MPNITKAQLQNEVEVLRHNYEQLEAKLIAAESQLAAERVARKVAEAELATAIAQRDEQLEAKYALQAQLTASSAIAAASKPLTYTRPTSMRGPRPRYEFDPAVPGDFQRAKALAIANGGVIVRAQGR